MNKLATQRIQERFIASHLSLSSKWLLIVLSLVLVGPVTLANAQDKVSKKSKATKAEKEPDSASDAKTTNDKPNEAKPKVTKLSGVFESLSTSEITADTEQLSELKIKRVLPHGTKVKKGQNVVWFETENIDKQIKNAETDFRLAKLTMEDDEFAFKQFQETQKLDRASAERKRKQAKQAFDNFVQVDRERQIKTAHQNLKSARASLDNASEELNQLEQMYKEDDLTEESEEIVLKRAKESVEYAEFRLEGTEISTERTLKQTIPRSEKQQKETFDRAEMTYHKSIRDLDIARQRREIEMSRKRDKFKEAEDKLAELKAEREKIVLRAGNDGIVFYGKLTRGKLSEKTSTTKAGAKISSDQVIATIVDPKRLQVRVDLAEKDLLIAQVGGKCTIVPTAYPKASINGTVKSVSSFPYVGGKYDCVITFRNAASLPDLLPSMSCELRFDTKADDSSEDSK